jgi:hypothetical protein
MAGAWHEQSKSWFAWSGTREDLRRILSTVESCVSPRIEAYVQREVEHIDRSIAEEAKRVAKARDELARLEAAPDEADDPHGYARSSAISDWTDTLSRSESSLAREKDYRRKRESDARQISRFSVQVVERDGHREEHSGNLDEVVSRIDPKRVREFRFRAPELRMTPFSIELKTDFRDRLELVVGAEDRDWRDSTFSQVSREIERRILPWGWIGRRENNLLPLWLVTLSVFVWIAVAISRTPTDLLSLISTAAWLSFGTAYGISALLRWLVPSHQVLEDGHKPKAIGVFVAIGTITLELTLGVLVAVLVPK